MEIVIYTSDPEVIDISAIKRAIEELGYYVRSVTVEDRGEEDYERRDTDT